MANKIIPYGKHEISEKDIDEVIKVLKSDFLTQGPNVSIFENKFATYVGSKYAVAVSNATAALHLATLTLNLKPGDKVITTPITFVASANCIRYAGGDVDFVDIDPKTYLLDLDKLKNKLENCPHGTYKGIIAVDFAGRSLDYQKLKKIADDYNLWIIEDACHAPGGYFLNNENEKNYCGSCTFVDLSVFSFHPVKHIACGEGGMITTNSEMAYRHLINLRTHGIQQNHELDFFKKPQNWYYEMQDLGFNYRLTEIQAALGISQLDRAKSGLEKRKLIAKTYFEYFSNKDYILGQSGILQGHAYHLYIIEVENRDELYNYLRTKNIITQVHYIPCHLMPYYSQFGWKEGDFEFSENYYKRCLTLPIFPNLKNDDLVFILEMINNFFINHSN